jgi:hypothetical protein
VTVGDLYTPRHLVNRGYTATEQRDYPDGVRLVVCRTVPNGFSDHYRYIVFAWRANRGTDAGSIERLYLSPADISAAVTRLRKMVTS